MAADVDIPSPFCDAANKLEAALSCAHVPNHLLRMLGAVVQAANLSPILTQSMNMNIVRASASSLSSSLLMSWLASAIGSSLSLSREGERG